MQSTSDDVFFFFFFFSSRRRHTRSLCDWSSDVCSSDLLLSTTLVVVTGEFGRTPRINRNAGRDHWGPAFTVALGGGGIRGGRVIGRTDARAERPAADPRGPEDLAATIYHLLGINPDDEFHTPDGRPVRLVNNGRVIRELL